MQPYNRYTGEGTGFSFTGFTADELLATVRRALAVWQDEPVWQRLVQNAMAADFGWGQSAAQYAAVYRDLLEN